MLRKLFSTCFVALWTGLLSYMHFRVRTEGVGGFFVAVGISAVVWILLLWLMKKDCFPFKQRVLHFNQKLYDWIDGVTADKYIFVYAWILSFFVFLFAYIAFFPGIFGYDAPIQFAMFMGDMKMTTQHPVLHTLFNGELISLGKMIFGSYQVGFALLVGIQGLIISNCMAQMVVFMKRRRVFPFFILLALATVFVNPFMQVLSCNVTKDVLFGVFVVDFLMALIHMLETEKITRSAVFALVCSGILMCGFRNGMIVPVLLVFLVGVLMKTMKKQLILSFVAILAVAEVFSLVSIHIAQIEKGPSREYLSVPIQQLAFLIYQEGNQMRGVQMETAEREQLEQLFSETSPIVTGFVFDCADVPKSLFQEEVFKKAPLQYISLYLKLGKKNLDAYRHAWLALIQPYFDMNYNVNRHLMLSNTFSYFYEKEPYLIHSDAKYFGFYREYLEKKVPDTVRLWNDPLLALLLMGLIIGRGIFLKERKIFVSTMFLWIYFSGLLLAPIALYRYAYPLMLSIPVLTGLLVSGKTYCNS